MFIAEKRINSSTWTICEEVNTGDTFLIQNISSQDNVRYCVLDSVPDNNIVGGIIRPFQQLEFKKVSGDLYLKQQEDDAYIVIEKVE